MSQPHVHFKINQPHVVAENFGDEIVAIHMERGIYYSIEKSGVDIWTLATAGATVDEITAEITLRYRDNFSVPAIGTTVQNFLHDLHQAELVVPYSNGGSTPTTAMPLHRQPGVTKQPFELPILREYSDMQDLLLLDPIHDVDAAGWPSRK